MRDKNDPPPCHIEECFKYMYDAEDNFDAIDSIMKLYSKNRDNNNIYEYYDEFLNEDDKNSDVSSLQYTYCSDEDTQSSDNDSISEYQTDSFIVTKNNIEWVIDSNVDVIKKTHRKKK
tara:strand:- start:290 stop:643 length:354 start_codon:yes stop_codon:yes gene_type:complete